MCVSSCVAGIEHDKSDRVLVVIATQRRPTKWKRDSSLKPDGIGGPRFLSFSFRRIEG